MVYDACVQIFLRVQVPYRLVGTCANYYNYLDISLLVSRKLVFREKSSEGSETTNV